MEVFTYVKATEISFGGAENYLYFEKNYVPKFEVIEMNFPLLLNLIQQLAYCVSFPIRNFIPELFSKL